jgi:hypothetical protein
MSKNLTLFDGDKLPAYLQSRELDDVTKALISTSFGDSKRISIKGGVWRCMINGKEVSKNEERSLPIVVVNAAPYNSRTYYEGAYSEDNIVPPDCWSSNGITPDAKAKTPQSKRCVDCPQNIKGSGQGDSRACRYNRRLAVVLANDIGGDVYQITLPAQSIFGEGEHNKWPLEAYGKFVASKGIPITALVTEARFDTDSATPKITFKPLRFLEPHEHAEAIKQGESEEAKKMLLMTVAEVDHVKEPKAVKSEATKTEVVETATSEPVKRTSKKAEEPAKKVDLMATLDAWDDE